MSAASAASSTSSVDLDRRLRVVDDPQPLLEDRARQHPGPRDPQLLRRERLLRVDLVALVALDPRVGHLDRAAPVAAGRRLEQDRAGPVDAHDRAREPAGVAVVQAEAARVGVDVAERVGQQVLVALLEHLDAAEVRGLDDRADDRLEVARSLRIGRGRRGLGHRRTP